MASNEQVLGRISWYDLSTTDIPGALGFYGKVVGWKSKEFANQQMPYHTLIAPVGEVAGVMDLTQNLRDMGIPPNWIAYVTVPNIPATCAKATELGGKVFLPEMAIPEVGTIAVLGDPQGAVFALYSAIGDVPGHDNHRGPGEITWHELITTDPEAALEFYTTLFGWTKLGAAGEGPEKRLFLGRGDLPLISMAAKSDNDPIPPRWLIYFNVEDILAAVAQLEEGGGKLLSGIVDLGCSGFAAVCMDPQGAVFGLHASPKK